MFLLVTAFSACWLAVSAQNYIQGATCNQAIPAQSNFQINQFTGKWHQIERISSPLDVGQCSTTEYSLLGTNLVKVSSRQVYNSTAHFTNGTATIVSTDGSGKLNVTFPDTGNAAFPYWVLSTDYTNYALVYACVPFNFTTRAVYAWKLSRALYLNSTYQLMINNYIQYHPELQTLQYISVSQDKEACHVNAASSLHTSVVLLAAVVISGFRGVISSNTQE